jgi:hypothetical protein
MPDTPSTRKRGIVKFTFWAIIAACVTIGTVRSYTSGQMVAWFYHRAAESGYAINVNTFKQASKDNPASLRIVGAAEIDGPVAVRVRKGDLLPRNANGVISDQTLAKGKRALVTGSVLKVLVPWEIKEAKGFKFKDSFQHKGIETWPWSGVWNVLIVLLLGISLGLMAEGFTDMLGIRIEKIQHHHSQGARRV